MIVRVWRGATSAEHGEQYLRYLEATGVRASRETPGNLGVTVLRRPLDGRTEFMFVSRWESMEAVRRFAGADPGRAVFYPRDADFLVEPGEAVEHFEVALESPATAG